MREEESNWFTKWEEELPPPDELISLSQTLITPDLAMAFDITIRNNPIGNHPYHRLLQHPPPPPPPPHQLQNTPSSQPNSPGEFESSDLAGTIVGGGGGAGGGAASGGGDEAARTLKRPRLVWTPQLHKRFVDAVAHLGIKNAVPKTIMQLMSVDGLTRENVASHLQKYRLYLKRMQGISNGGGSGGSDTDHLFASSPVPPHFLHPAGRVNSDHFLPFLPVTSLQQHHHHHQMAAVVGHHHHHNQQQFRQFGTSPPNGQFENPFLSRQSQSQIQSIMRTTPLQNSYVEDMDSTKPTANGRKVLTLFPTADD